jgi:hypothetical protein
MMRLLFVILYFTISCFSYSETLKDYFEEKYRILFSYTDSMFSANYKKTKIIYSTVFTRIDNGYETYSATSLNKLKRKIANNEEAIFFDYGKEQKIIQKDDGRIIFDFLVFCRFEKYNITIERIVIQFEDDYAAICVLAPNESIEKIKENLFEKKYLLFSDNEYFWSSDDEIKDNLAKRIRLSNTGIKEIDLWYNTTKEIVDSFEK